LSPQIVLATENLTKRFGRRTVVDGLSLEVSRGEVFGFLGPNGAGKSTTLRMIVGLVRPSGGRIQIAGIDAAEDRRAALARVGAVVEAPAFYPRLSAWENLRIFASLSGAVRPAEIERALEVVGLRERARDPVAVYSTGMRQRLGIAQALLPRPDLILLDEPGNGLDPRGNLEIRNLIRTLADDHALTIFLSSHLLHEVEQLCGKVAILDRGRLLYQGSVAGLLTRASYLRVGLDAPGRARDFLARIEGVQILLEEPRALTLHLTGVEAAWLNERLVGQGFRIHELTPVQESLESIFLRLTGGKGAAAA
jgi:ABC-2 type transport system ATP-binding protein